MATKRMQHLDEGVIQHIDRIKVQVRDFVLSVLASRMIENTRATGSESAVDIIKQALAAYYPNIKLTKIKTKNFRSPTIDEVPANYRKFYDQAVEYWEQSGTLRVRCHFSEQSFGGTHGGEYGYGTNHIDLNCSIVETFDYDKFAQLVEAGEQRKYVTLATNWLGKMMLPVAVAYHELIHYIQYSFLVHGHEQQIKPGRDPEDHSQYWTSNIEIPAQIEGYAVGAKTWVLKYKRYFPKLSTLLYGRYLVGDITPDQFSQLSGVNMQYVPTKKNGGVIAFFIDLKRMRPKAYQRAAKHFMQKMLS